MFLVPVGKYLLNFEHYFEKNENAQKNAFFGTLGQK